MYAREAARRALPVRAAASAEGDGRRGPCAAEPGDRAAGARTDRPRFRERRGEADSPGSQNPAVPQRLSGRFYL